MNPLAQTILATIDEMFERPKMFASSGASFEEQFCSLFSLVAPYTEWGFDEIEALEKLRSLAYKATGGSNLTLSSVFKEPDAMAKFLEAWYRNGFKVPEASNAN